ncbi:GreA/GreB family elongation factor [Prosthecobacter sp. SYSU 5D2]|uniref:GreA/GreB family elongation factor n=1 Tax=Prosthecobacter sp. SYSU 5D2 TaxID=3134134 RepID=UPI0031FE512A
MSRAFVKEDIDIPERITRRRSVSGLPPGALNLITARGAKQLKARFAALSKADQDPEAHAHLRETLESMTVVEPQVSSGAIVFGSRVTLRNAAGQVVQYRIAGVDEVDLEPENVSWVSPLGKTLLAANVGQGLRLTKDDKTLWTVVQAD